LILRAAAGDLRKDVRDMRKQGCGPWHVLAVRVWITTTVILAIVWDGMMRLSQKLPVLGTMVRLGSAILRKVDPPKFG
jgi:hypothetical protein